MSGDTAAGPPPVGRSFTVTVQVTVRSDADLRDPFIRFAMFRALADQLAGTPLRLDTPHGPATAEFGLVTGVS